MFGLIVSLDMLLHEGMKNVYARHAHIAKASRDGARTLGLAPLVSDDKYASNTVTAIMGTNGMDATRLIAVMRDEFKIELAAGQGNLLGKIFRIGHLGWVTEDHIKDIMVHLKEALPKAGFKGN
jgi:aspartate aminotransferase-like enzyme